MEITNITMGKKITIKYNEGPNERVLKSNVDPSPEFFDALLALGKIWTDKECKALLNMDFESYSKKLVDARIIEDKNKDKPFLHPMRVDLEYNENGGLVAYSITGSLKFPPGQLFLGDFTFRTVSLIEKDIDNAVVKLVKEAAKYVKGKSAEMSLWEQTEDEDDDED